MQGLFIANPGDQGHSTVGNGNKNVISCNACLCVNEMKHKESPF